MEIGHTFVFSKIMLRTGEHRQDNIAFSESTLTTSLKHLVQNCYFMVGNSLLKQKIDILIRINLAPFWPISIYTRMKINTCLILFQMIK